MNSCFLKPISKYPQLPCIKESCLKLPMCKFKTAVWCDALAGYHEELRQSPRYYNEKSIWFKTRKVLPIMSIVMKDKRRK